MNISAMTHCPYCGAMAVTVAEEGKVLRCDACEKMLFDNQAAAVGVVLRAPDGRVALSERARNPHKGKYDFPGGFVDRDENLEQAAVRELREELGITIDTAQLRYLCSGYAHYDYAGTTTHITDAHFVLDIDAATIARIRPADDVAQIHWMQPTAVRDVQMAFASGVDVVRRLCVQWLRQGCDHNLMPW